MLNDGPNAREILYTERENLFGGAGCLHRKEKGSVLIIFANRGDLGQEGINLHDGIDDADQADEGNKTAGEKIHDKELGLF